MNANLMGSSSFKSALQIGCRFERLEGAIVRHRVLAPGPCDVRPDQRHLLAIGRRAGDRPTDRACGRQRSPRADRMIGALDRMIGELAGESLVRGGAFGDHEQAGGVLVDPVDDPRPRNPADTRQLTGTVMQQRVDQRPVEVARRRMDHQPGGLVDHDQVLVLEHDGEGYILCLGDCRDRCGHMDRPAGAFEKFGRSLRGRFAIDQHPPLAQQRLDPLSRKAARLGQSLVEPRAVARQHTFDSAFRAVFFWPHGYKMGIAILPNNPNPFVLSLSKHRPGPSPMRWPSGVTCCIAAGACFIPAIRMISSAGWLSTRAD